MSSANNTARNAPAAARPPVDPVVPLKAQAVVSRMVIGGCPTESATGACYTVHNPANQTVVGTVPLGGPADARRAIDAAQAALESWRSLPVGVRAEAVQGGLEAVAAALGELAVLLTCEQGKPLAESAAEIDSFLERMRTFVRVACAGEGRPVPVLPSAHEEHGRVTEASARVTVGLVAWNFPVGLLAKKMGPTVMTGGTVVLKPAFTAPLAASRVVELMNRGGIPPGVINCVTGRGHEIGEALVTDPGVGCIHLTGDDSTGDRIKLMARVSEHELYLHVAGSDAMIVCADADLDRAVSAAVAGRYLNAGQACIAVKRLYVEATVWNQFLDDLCRLIQLRQPGDGLIPTAPPYMRMGPLHTDQGRERIEEQLADAVRQGADVIVGGRRPHATEIPNGYFFEPTLVTNVSTQSRLITEEVFGPVLPVFKVDRLEDAVEQANQSPWHQNISIWTNDRDSISRIDRQIRCRRLWVNRLPFGAGQAS